MHLVMRPVDTSQPPPPTSGAAGPHSFGPMGMGGGFPIAFRGGPNGAIDPNDFGSVRSSMPQSFTHSLQKIASQSCRGNLGNVMYQALAYFAMGAGALCSNGTGPGMLLCKLQAQCLTCLSLCVALHACGSEPHSIALSMLACSLLPACWAAWVSRALYRSCTPRFPWSGLQTWVSFRHICTLNWQWP